jgi:hypothetical protein
VRDQERALIIALKRRRRLALGGRCSLLFENRATVLFQVQEMVRAERLLRAADVERELDAWNGLLPGDGELSATLFVEIPVAGLSAAEIAAALEPFRGIERDALFLDLGGDMRLPAVFDGEPAAPRVAAVRYLRFRVSVEASRRLADPAWPARLLLELPGYRAQRELPPETRAELLADLAAAPA